jgi:hypothetical protein
LLAEVHTAGTAVAVRVSTVEGIITELVIVVEGTTSPSTDDKLAPTEGFAVRDSAEEVLLAHVKAVSMELVVVSIFVKHDEDCLHLLSYDASSSTHGEAVVVRFQRHRLGL